MERQSEWAVDLANKLAAEVWYPRMADFVSKAIQHCAGDAKPLSEEQCEQLYRASFEAGDGVTMDIAHVIDQEDALRLLQTIAPWRDFPLRAGDGLDGPHDGEAGR